VYVRGRVNAREDMVKLIAEEIIPMDEVKKRKTKSVAIDLPFTDTSSERLKLLKEILAHHSGATPVLLHFKDAGGRSVVLDSGDSYRVEATDDFFRDLESLLGAGTIKIRC